MVKAAKPLQIYFSRKVGTIDVTIELPAGSQVRGEAALGEFACEGRLGECMLKTASGDISLDRAGALKLTTTHGRVTVNRVAGHAQVTGSGDIRLGKIDGGASIKNLNGDSWIGEVSGDVSLNSAHGGIFVDRAGSSIVARTAYGDVRIGEVTRGSVVLQTASGALEVGIREGTAAWLDVKSSSGRVRNSLESTDRPEPAAETVEIRARTYDGDIVIRRAGVPQTKRGNHDHP